MIKRGNKKAQAGIENKTVNWIIAIFVILVIAGGIYMIWNKGESIAGNTPQELEILVQSCSLVASETLKTSYCLQLREFGKDNYVTCGYKFTDDTYFEGAKAMQSVCNDLKSELEKNIKEECTTGKFKDNKRVIINGKKCVEWSVGEESKEEESSK